jgi:hypothetical protein
VSEWVVIVPQGIWTKCYGTFASQDLAMAWVRRNQFDVEEVQVHPINHDEPEPRPESHP